MAADEHHRGRLLRGGRAGRRRLRRLREQAAASPPRPPRPLPAPPLSPTAAPDAHAHPHAVTGRRARERTAHTPPSGTAARKVGIPPAKPRFKAAKYQATIKTNRGTIVLDLLNHKATCTVNSFIYLAAKNYFNNTPCHRLTTAGIFVLQCGDPTGTGSGGPGYKFANENLTGAKYTAGHGGHGERRARAPTGASSSSFIAIRQRCRRATRPSAKSSADWESSRMWPRQAQTTATATVMAIRRRRSPSKASLLLRPDTPFTWVQV